MIRGLLFTLLCSVLTLTHAQIVRLDPVSAGSEDPVTIFFDATQGNGELVGVDKVYMHHGVVTSDPEGTSWQYVVGNWGSDDGVGEMTKVDGETDLWSYTMSPSIREYYGVPEGENIFRISCVFRSADGSTKGTIAPGEYGWGTVAGNLDIYINLDNSAYVSITKPSGFDGFYEGPATIQIEGTASAAASEIKIWLDEGTGYEEKASAIDVQILNYDYSLTQTTDLGIKVTATIDGEEVVAVKTFNAVIVQSNVVQPVPSGVHLGINYHDDNDSTVTLALLAPGKDFAYVVGDMNDWKVQDEYQMKYDPSGVFWLELSGLTPNQTYVYQYWVDGEVKIGDPYADQVADPWNDPFIALEKPEVFPNLPEYHKTEYEIATVFQTGQVPYEWAASEDTWQRPDVNHLVIYELHIRDFLGSSSYQDLIDTLSYIKRLGVDAIELMPISEFEGNDSWGYNPSYYFAVDKYYGTKDKLKEFIETAHQEGMAVILDMVLNHSFGQSPMVRLYFDRGTGRVTADNPWYNVDYVGPFEWGYDFNHTSQYVKDFMDSVNTYWISEFHFDGFRFDFTKGFTQNGGQFDSYNPERIDILKRMADKIWEVDDECYIILEHWGPGNEESELAQYGMKLWRNKSYDYVPAILGNTSNNFTGVDATTHMSLISSHDEQRIAYEALNHGQSKGTYDIKNPLNTLERIKMGAAFHLLNPGLKLIWQFDELGYDISIDFNGRTGRKPLPWGDGGLGYYEDELRQHVYTTYKEILDLRRTITPQVLNNAIKTHKHTGTSRRLAFNTNGTDVILVGNFGVDEDDLNHAFTETGDWFDYFSGEEIDVTVTNEEITLQPGEWHIYTSERLSDGFPGVVETFLNPVTVDPEKFRVGDEITITFDPSKAFSDGTNGLVGASNVFMYAGIVTEDPKSENLVNQVDNGSMTSMGNDLWEITLIPEDYFSVTENQEVFRIGMYFKDADGTNVGKGFRNQTIFFNLLSETSIVTVEPASFDIDTEITITLDAKRGNGALVGAGEVYMHSGVGLTPSDNPGQSAWNNVVGNWGLDDGVGELTPVAGKTDVWEIKLTPRTYYGLDDGNVVYWIAMVFRNANGDSSLKQTATSEELPNGIISESGDWFVRNDFILGTSNEPGVIPKLFPNPTRGAINLSQFGNQVQLEVFNLSGRKVYETSDQKPQLYHLNRGVYIYAIQSEKGVFSGKLILE